jgi:hypothetical protein
MRDSLKLSGEFHFEQFRSGVLLDERHVRNLIVNGGFAAVAGLIIQTGSTSPFSYLAIGQSTQAAASTDTSLYLEISGTSGGGARSLATLSRVTTDTTNDTAQLAKTFLFTTTGTYAITEAGVFNTITTSSGTMLCRQTFTAINVVALDVLNLTYKLDID